MFRHEARTSAASAVSEVEISVVASEPVVLHWGIAGGQREAWSRPPESLWPEGTRAFGDGAVQTPFGSDGKLVLRVPAGLGPSGLAYVFFFPQTSRWDNGKGKNYWVDLGFRSEPVALSRILERIVEAEVERSSWTLMHRYDLCTELLGGAGGDTEALALLFVWLRFSATRQLDWQRRYNTQPRLLTHAQNRLTRRIASVWREHPETRHWVRWLLTTVGRGGEGQRIRDEILNIMHRHHVREQAGRFLEQWHQKLHNNATPDDVGIARAYLEFLRTDGDLRAFDRELGRHGITRERLAGYERPITSNPEFHPQAKAGLIRDFSAYLRLLESIHASADLASSFGAARGALGEELESMVAKLILPAEAPADEPKGEELVRTIELGLKARRLLGAHVDQTTDDGLLRDMLYLDGALLDQTRGTVERVPADALDLPSACRCLRDLLDHVRLSHPSQELDCVAHQAGRLVESAPTSAQDQALHARSIAERTGRALGTTVETLTSCLQPVAERLGRGLKIQDWAISGFSEAVVRGSSLFALARLLNLLDPLLRREAELGPWQVICPGRSAGRVERAEDLRTVQGKDFAAATVLLVAKVYGEEEIPRGVVAVLTLDNPDLVSHAAVRARNQHVLFATCYDPARWKALEAELGSLLEIESTPAGEVIWRPATAESGGSQEPRVPSRTLRALPPPTAFAIGEAEYSPERVGNKSRNLAELRRALPKLQIPPSFAIPFGVCERVLANPVNRQLFERFQKLVATLATRPTDTLAELRRTLEALEAPPELERAVARAARDAGLEGLEVWEPSWAALKRVWASKWNDRAYYARQNAGVADGQLVMAVLVQPVIEADHAFVLHTVNPVTRNPDELYGEMVWGLGETLVGNDPGAPLGFVVPRSGAPVLRGYPSKSHALRGKGVIFRSDSNGEDLEGYSGAGLYASVTAQPTRRELIDYGGERMLWDQPFRQRLLGEIAAWGRQVERALGAPQDIEGAVAKDRIVLLQARPQVGL